MLRRFRVKIIESRQENWSPRSSWELFQVSGPLPHCSVPNSHMGMWAAQRKLGSHEVNVRQVITWLLPTRRLNFKKVPLVRGLPYQSCEHLRYKYQCGICVGHVLTYQSWDSYLSCFSECKQRNKFSILV